MSMKTKITSGLEMEKQSIVKKRKKKKKNTLTRVKFAHISFVKEQTSKYKSLLFFSTFMLNSLTAQELATNFSQLVITCRSKMAKLVFYRIVYTTFVKTRNNFTG